MTLDELISDKRAVIPIPEAGALLGVRRSEAYRLAASGAIPTLQLGERRRVVPRLVLLQLLGVSPDAIDGPPKSPSTPPTQETRISRDQLRE